MMHNGDKRFFFFWLLNSTSSRKGLQNKILNCCLLDILDLEMAILHTPITTLYYMLSKYLVKYNKSVSLSEVLTISTG